VKRSKGSQDGAQPITGDGQVVRVDWAP
jgi:hypothetical protein